MQAEGTPARVRAIRLAVLAGALVAALGVLGLATSGDADHLGGEDGVDAWCFVFGVGVLLALLATYPLLHMRAQRRSKPDGVFSAVDRAFSLWGAIALALGAVFALIGVPSDYSGADVLGSMAILGMIACGIVVAIVVAVVVG